MPLRLIHTSDIHLDSMFAVLPDGKGRAKRLAIRTVFRRIIDDCLQWGADALLIAGDLYEGERVSPDTIGFLKSEFARLGDTPVIIAPGNHDPFVPKSPYAAAEWGEHVHIFDSPELATFDLPEVPLRVVGLAHSSHQMPGRLTDKVAPCEKGGAPSVLLVHASLQAAGVTEKSDSDIWLPFTEAELADLSYAYAAIGHYHNPSEMRAGGRIIGAYAGAPEGLNFSEQGRRSYTRVTIEDGGVEIERVPVSEIEYLAVRIGCEGFETRTQFFDAVARGAPRNADRVIMRAEAAGRVATGFRLSAEPPGELSGRFFHLAVSDSTVPDYDWEALGSENSLRGAVVQRFAEAIAAADEESRGELELARLYAMEALEGRNIELPAEVLRAD